MFGRAEKISGTFRAYPVRDAAALAFAVDAVNRKDPFKTVRALRVGDVARPGAAQRAIAAVNVTGRQCHLLLDRIGGVDTCLLVYAALGAADALPLRFSPALHAAGVVARCTINYPAKLLVVDAVCLSSSQRSPEGAFAMVHEHHAPDAFAFPLRVVTRRTFTLAQSDDLARFVDARANRCHSVSLVAHPPPPPHSHGHATRHGADLRVLVREG